jgi:tetratricopeptide (TPR) repeat protein
MPVRSPVIRSFTPQVSLLRSRAALLGAFFAFPFSPFAAAASPEAEVISNEQAAPLGESTSSWRDTLAQFRADESERTAILDRLEAEFRQPVAPELPDPVVLEALEGLAALEAGNFEQAVPSFEAVIEADPTLRMAWLHLIEAQRQRDDREDFLAVTDRYLETFQDDYARQFCGRAWMQLRDWSRLAPLRQYFAENPPVPTERLSPPAPREAMEKPFISLVILDQLLKEEPHNIGNLFRLGDLLCYYGKPEEGRAQYEQVLALEPENLRAAVSRARASKLLHDPETGLQAIRHAEELLMTDDSLSEVARTRLGEELESLLVEFLTMQEVPGESDEDS